MNIISDRRTPPAGAAEGTDALATSSASGDAAPYATASHDSGHTAIVRAARRAFALQPYAAVTLRAIAADAGVSASLILKYFGSKDQLFDTVADFGEDVDLLLAVPNPELAHHLVTTMLDMRRRNQMTPLLRVVFALTRQDEAAMLRTRFRDQVVSRLAERLAGPDARERAGLILAQVIGLGVMAFVDPAGPIGLGDPHAVADRVAPAIQRLVDGE